MTVPQALAGIINVNFSSTVNIGGADQAVDGTFVLDDTLAFDDSIIGGQVVVGSDVLDIITPSGFTFAATGSNVLGFNGDYGPQVLGIALYSDTLGTITDPFAALLALTFDDLTPYDPTNVATSNFTLVGVPFEAFIGPITAFSVTTSTTTVTEPATTALLTLGIVLLGVGYRRRRIA